MNIGFIGATPIFGARCGTNPTFYPGYDKPNGGGKVDHRCTVSLMINNMGKKLETGGRATGEKSYINLTAWGNQAEMLALGASEGKELSFMGIPDDYLSRVTVNGVAVLGADGKELMVRKTGYTLVPGSIRWGSDSAKHIANGIADGTIAIGHDGTIPVAVVAAAMAQGLPKLQELVTIALQGKERQRQILAAWNAQKYTPGMTKFGNAEVKGAVTSPASAYNPVSPVVPEPNIDGITLKMLLDGGWDMQQVLTSHNGHYAALAKGANTLTPIVPAPTIPVTSVPAPSAPAASNVAALFAPGAII